MIDRLHKPFLFLLVGSVCAVAAIVIAKIWGVELPEDLFFKIIATLGVLILLFGFLLVVNSDFGQHKKLKDENYLD
jgi:Mn2+/Fe2+ NRAMP family transporter